MKSSSGDSTSEVEDGFIIPELENAAPAYRQWSAFEEKVVSKYYSRVTPRAISEYLKKQGYNRSIIAVMQKAKALGVACRRV